jgi:hypothetical protein
MTVTMHPSCATALNRSGEHLSIAIVFDSPGFRGISGYDVAGSLFDMFKVVEKLAGRAGFMYRRLNYNNVNRLVTYNLSPSYLAECIYNSADNGLTDSRRAGEIAEMKLSFDHVITVKYGPSETVVSYEKIDWVEPALRDDVLCYATTTSGGGYLLSLSARPMPLQPEPVPLPLEKPVFRTVDSYGVISFSSPKTLEALGTGPQDAAFQSNTNHPEGLYFVGNGMPDLIVRRLLEKTGFDPAAELASVGIYVEKLNGTKELVKRDASSGCTVEWHEHRYRLKFGVRTLRASLYWLMVPILQRPATKEQALKRLAEVAGLKLESAKALAEAYPKIIDAAYLEVKKLDLIADRQPETAPVRDFVEPVNIPHGRWEKLNRPLTFRGKRGAPGELSRYLGVEIEVAKTENYGVANMAIRSVKASAMDDGSLPSAGVEIVTQPARGKQFRLDIKNLTKGLTEAGTKVDKSCGLHVHVDARDLDTFGVQRLAALWSHIEPAMFDLVAYSRRENRYSKPCSDVLQPVVRAKSSNELRQSLYEMLYSMRVVDTGSKMEVENRKKRKHGGERYTALNLQSWFMRRTIEFRLHQGCLRGGLIIGFAEICGWIVLNR